MNTRQAINGLILLSLLTTLVACTFTIEPTATPSVIPPTFTSIPSSTPIPSPTIIPTATPLGCLTQPGTIVDAAIDITKPPQQFIVYLPPCYDQQTDLRYPVLYLLHGQTYIYDQWTRLGAVDIANQLIISGEAQPFIMVFPDDRYWNLPPGPGFGVRFIDFVIPYIDQNYRTLADREHRALGGLSRGGGWTIRLGLSNWQMFGMLGLHSPVVFAEDGPFIQRIIEAVPAESFPRLWVDIGDQDAELAITRNFQSLLVKRNVAHEFHFYSGNHTETYWSKHVEEYIRWYVDGWK